MPRGRIIHLSLAFAAATTIAHSLASAQTVSSDPPSSASASKEVLIPKRVNRVPDGNDYDNPESEFCYKRSKSSANFVLFWAKEYGDDPAANSVDEKRFSVDEVLAECERFYDFYANELRWLDMRKSLASKYKFLIYVFGGDNTSAYGGNIDNKIGALWTPAVRIHRAPYGVLAHELGHGFQDILRADGSPTFHELAIYEMTSQFMLFQVYPEWMTFENYHLVDLMKATHLAFLHEDNMYHAAYVLEYWSNKHGVEFVGRLWREADGKEDPVMAYKRLTLITQRQFDDEMFDAARRFVTWDIPRIEKVAARYANQHATSLVALADGWYKTAPDKCPQNYGYNAIRLEVPEAQTKVKLEFEGIVGADGFRSIRPEKAGWRYGFVASKEDGTRDYSEIFFASPGTAEFTVPANTKSLWLVVTGAPTEHWTHVEDHKAETDEQWPYRFRLTGTAPDKSSLH